MKHTLTKGNTPLAASLDDLDNLLNDAQVTLAESHNTSNHGYPFEAMSLRVGDRLQAQPPSKVSTDRFYVRLIGYLQDMSLLITTPVSANGVRLQLIENDQLVMRVFANQSAFGFASDVQRVCKLPYSYLHIAYPKNVQGMVVRKAPRVKTKIIAKVRRAHGHHEHTGVISNLSASGVLLDGRHDLADSADTLCLEFKVKLHNIEAHLAVSAVVRTVFTDKSLEQNNSALAHFGMEFVGLQPNDQMVLQSMVYQQMIEQPQSLV
ncbi:MAG: flagellar brake protein [Rhodoferax sp.]|nr:flagellar brake protein [Rhodoferax sp.]PIZ22761.1 MAG: hypothetical protein COY49_06845 [Comamonadaceae bacterium CG_4_10_14_0_8_um_filter_57_29]PJC16822.1 MAG: hypothetical protein CO065_10180 [Comamonadaceae bacterium CG_4_9_14_0_8_um_filter_57_21]